MPQYLDMFFDWDERKKASNKKKHDISFEEAMTAFSDIHAVIEEDKDHLVVCHCYKNNDDIIRIISARKANRHEEKRYRGGKG